MKSFRYFIFSFLLIPIFFSCQSTKLTANLINEVDFKSDGDNAIFKSLAFKAEFYSLEDKSLYFVKLSDFAVDDLNISGGFVDKSENLVLGSGDFAEESGGFIAESENLLASSESFVEKSGGLIAGSENFVAETGDLKLSSENATLLREIFAQKSLTLTRAISASGERYVNETGKIELWLKGKEATLTFYFDDETEVLVKLSKR